MSVVVALLYLSFTEIPVNDFSSWSQITLASPTPPATSLNTHDLLFSPDGTKYFVTCQSPSHEVLIMQSGTDQLLARIPVGDQPSEMAVSAKYNYLFVTCEGDQASFPGKTGSVAVIDITSNSLVQTIYSGHQPHGIGLDDNKGVVFVANRNTDSNGIPPHHTSICGGKNGYITFIDMNTLTLIKRSGSSTEKRIEVAVDPYSIAVRH